MVQGPKRPAMECEALREQMEFDKWVEGLLSPEDKAARDEAYKKLFS